MLDLTKAILPSSVNVDGMDFPIQTDFRFWLNFSRIVSDGRQHELSEFDFLYKEEVPVDRQKGLDELMAFYLPNNPLPRVDESSGDEIIFDYDIDSEMIYSGFYQQYGIDLLDENLRLHFHKFRALLSGLKGTKLNDVMGYRLYVSRKDGSYEKDMLKLKAAWKIEREEELTEEEKKMLEEFDSKVKC